MTIKINGKPFDFDSTDLYEGEGAKPKLNMNVLLITLLLCGVGYLCYPYIIQGLIWLFSPLLPLGIY